MVGRTHDADWKTIPENSETRWISDVYEIGMETVDIVSYIQFPLFCELLTFILTKNSVFPTCSVVGINGDQQWVSVFIFPYHMCTDKGKHSRC